MSDSDLVYACSDLQARAAITAVVDAALGADVADALTGLLAAVCVAHAHWLADDADPEALLALAVSAYPDLIDAVQARGAA